MRRQKPRRIAQRILLRRKRRRIFLSEAGPRVRRCTSQAGHHSSRCVDLLPDTTKATLSDRPRSSSHTAKRLARRPLREGRRCHGRALVQGRAPERDRRGVCRFGEDHGVVVARHVEMHLRPNVGCAQVSFRSSNELRVHDVRNASRNFRSAPARRVQRRIELVADEVDADEQQREHERRERPRPPAQLPVAVQPETAGERHVGEQVPE